MGRGAGPDHGEDDRVRLCTYVFSGGCQTKRERVSDRAESKKRDYGSLKDKIRHYDPFLYDYNKNSQPDVKTAILHEKSGNTSSKTEKTGDDSLSMLTKEALSVYHTISETPKAAETIGEELGISTDEVMTALSELEMLGLMETNGYGFYQKK